MKPEEVVIGIGSNLGDSIHFVRSAIDCIAGIKSCTLRKQSSLYRSVAVSDIPQDDYINAVVAIDCELEPFDLLLELQAIEHAFYRQREDSIRWGPRTLDLDIILFGTRIMSDSHLVVPHREMANRLFVLVPLMEIWGDFYITGNGSLKYLIDQAQDISLEKVAV
jgi:2-amino-4-hydroxy-6-hydroxymethyldihydropteridine diphosphokinase